MPDPTTTDNPRSDERYWLAKTQRLLTNVRGWINTGCTETATREIEAYWKAWCDAD